MTVYILCIIYSVSLALVIQSIRCIIQKRRLQNEIVRYYQQMDNIHN